MRPQAKFTFDTEFRSDGDRMAPAAHARQKKTLTVEEIDRLKAEAHAEGQGTAEIRNAEALERSIAALTISLRAVLGQSLAEIEAVRTDAAAIALAAASKLAHAALAALPLSEIETALRHAMHEAIGEPRLVLRAAPDITALIEPRIAELIQEEGFDGRIQLVADPHIAGADCRIEWRGGGAERNFAGLEAGIAEIVGARFSETQSSRSKG